MVVSSNLRSRRHPRYFPRRMAGLIARRERPRPKPWNQNHDHPGKRAERTALEKRLLEAVCEFAGRQRKLAHGPPKYRNMADQIVDQVLQPPDTEKPGVIVNRRVNIPAPAAHALDRVAVQHADEQAVFGHPAGFRQGLLRILYKFEGGEQASVIERVVVEWQIFGDPAVKITRLPTFFRAMSSI